MWIGIMALGVWYHFWPSERSVERARREAEEAGEGECFLLLLVERAGRS